MHKVGWSQWAFCFVACCLIALDKCPGARRIGVGKVVRRIVGKSILATVKMDILETAGPLQLCAGGCWL